MDPRPALPGDRYLGRWLAPKHRVASCIRRWEVTQGRLFLEQERQEDGVLKSFQDDGHGLQSVSVLAQGAAVEQLTCPHSFPHGSMPHLRHREQWPFWEVEAGGPGSYGQV